MDADAFRVDVTVRFRDLDPMGHVNNAVYATYLEHTRACYFREVISESLAEVDAVLVHLAIDYQSPIEFGDEVEVAMWIPRLGESSVPMEYEIYAGDAVAATAETVQVMVDPTDGRSTPIPDAWRSAIEADMDL